MKFPNILKSTFVIGLFLGLHVPAVGHAGTPGVAASDHVVTGELVVTNAARNQFRIVEHGGAFTAPAGTSVEALDGKPVRVEIGHDGRVLQITQMQINIEPITHGFDVISGELLVRDPMTRTVGIAGDSRTYRAPTGIDVSRYAGRMVEMRVDEQGQIMNINPISRSGDAPMAPSPRQCLLGGASLANGASICRNGTTFSCMNGEWVSLGTACN